MVRFRHSTAAANLAALRMRLPGKRGLTVEKIARWLLNNATDNQLKNAFGLGDARLAVLKKKLQNHADKLRAVEELEGE